MGLSPQDLPRISSSLSCRRSNITDRDTSANSHRAAGIGIGFAIDAWQPGGLGDVIGGVGGALAGAFGAAVIVRGALRRGGTRGGTALLVAGAALIAAALAWIPVVGFVEAIALPALAVRLRRRAPERYAGLRTLAK